MAMRGALALLSAVLVLFSATLGEAGTGSLKGTFKYKDPATGIEQILTYGFVYLHNASKPPPMEKYFSKADYVLGTTAGTPFVLNNIPEGNYYIRLLQRKVVGSSTRPFGPPEQGDYTWFQSTPITITAGTTLDLGTKYAVPFGSTIRISGTLRAMSTGAPATGFYVRAQTEPCSYDGENYNINRCGPTKFLAQAPADSSGRYTLYLKDPGTYYIYISACLTNQHSAYSGNRCPTRYTVPGPGPVTVSAEDSKTVDFLVN